MGTSAGTPNDLQDSISSPGRSMLKTYSICCSSSRILILELKCLTSLMSMAPTKFSRAQARLPLPITCKLLPFPIPTSTNINIDLHKHILSDRVQPLLIYLQNLRVQQPPRGLEETALCTLIIDGKLHQLGPPLERRSAIQGDSSQVHTTSSPPLPTVPEQVKRANRRYECECVCLWRSSWRHERTHSI